MTSFKMHITAGLLLCSLLLLNLAFARSSQQVLQLSDTGLALASQRLLITGTNHASDDRTLVIRIDDRARPPYADRVNLERVVPPGPFRLELGLGGLQTSGGRALDPASLKQVICFQGRGSGDLEIHPPLLADNPQLPAHSMAWDLGPAHSPLWPGFKRLTEDFAGLHGRQLKALDRGGRQQAVEGLTTDGIRGIERLSLPIPRGRWQVTLWLHDRGEWEYLPHPLERRISANGQLVWTQQYDAAQWIEQVYLGQRVHELEVNDDSWTLYGEQPQGRVSFAVDVTDNGLQLDFSGHMPEAGYLSAVVVERDASLPARRHIEAQRARWWRDNWRLRAPALASTSTPTLQGPPQPVVIARGTTAALDFSLSGGHSGIPRIELQAPSRLSTHLPVETRWAQWRWRRTTLVSTLLEPVDHLLRGDLHAMPATRLERRLNLRISVPADAPAGEYIGRLRISVDGHALSHAFSVQVPAVSLPEIDRPVGVYLERPVHFGWFNSDDRRQHAALECDLDLLTGLGLSGMSPGFVTPDQGADGERFLRELEIVSKPGLGHSLIAYAPFKRLLARIDLEAAAEVIDGIDQRARDASLPPVIWSIADEPSNAGQHHSLEKVSRYLRSFAPRVQIAAHLNHRDDQRYLEFVDLALINDGFGADKTDIDAVRASGAIPWLYNMRHMRAASGFYLWRVNAAGYLQWHARMPTADPFDPTDGREDDVQFLYPMATPCPDVADIDARLFAMVDGITDLRWLLWLKREAASNPRARQRLQELQQQVPVSWQDMLAVSEDQLDAWRQSIVELSNPATTRHTR